MFHLPSCFSYESTERLRGSAIVIVTLAIADSISMDYAVKAVDPSDDPEEWLVLLFYQYCVLLHPSSTCEDQRKLCAHLNLLGRIRVSCEGINGTIGGSRSSIQSYIAAVEAIPEFNSVEDPIHWKLGGLSKVQITSKRDYKFHALSVKTVKEVVSLDLTEAQHVDMIRAGPGRHLTPQEFHDALSSSKFKNIARSGKCDTLSIDNPAMADLEQEDVGEEVILLDVRNEYETKIGNFQIRDDLGNVISAATDPRTRQFSDFAKFVDANAGDYVGKKVLMYCTGGVRCERASAYLRSKGVDDVSQLSGGIHAYQEAFPDGGFFRGKNFVFDPRITVPSAANSKDVIGTCCLCLKLFDDYTRQCRCTKCRVLVLVCDECMSYSDSCIDTRDQISSTNHAKPLSLLCEHCKCDIAENT